jgi:hypothetical protein
MKEEFSMSKKLLYAILAGALSVSVLAACGEPADEPAPADDPAMETEDDIEVEEEDAE